MAEDLIKEIESINKEDQKKLKKLIEKDAKSARKPNGLWKWVTALLGASMVLFYFYTAGITTVSTQYHRGVYVFITYVLVFLLILPASCTSAYPLTCSSGLSFHLQ